MTPARPAPQTRLRCTSGGPGRPKPSHKRGCAGPNPFVLHFGWPGSPESAHKRGWRVGVGATMSAIRAAAAAGHRSGRPRRVARDRRGVDRGVGGGVRQPLVRLRRSPPARPLPGGGGCVRSRAGDLRHQGIPVPGDGQARLRRRVCCSTSPPAANSTWRCRPACPRMPAPCTATTSRATNSARRSRPRCATSSSTRSTNSIASTCSLRLASGRRRGSCCASPQACMRTPTSSSPPARTTRSSASTSPTVMRCAPSTTPAGPRRWSWSGCTATSARTSSKRRRSPRPPR